MNFNQLTILLLSLFLISACSAVKKVNKEETQERNISTPYLLQQLEEKAIDYEPCSQTFALSEVNVRCPAKDS